MEREKGIETINKLKENINGVIVGKEKVTELVLTGVIAGGHLLIEDMPGTGKTLMAKTFAASIDGEFSRVQFTPDLLPADITGLNIYNQAKGQFEFVRGPILTNIMLADEINRATPRTQSALLEAMEESQVTVDGNTYRLSEPFVVMATENPVETTGTFPLPEAQLDRFIMRLSMGSLSAEEEIRMLNVINEGKVNEKIEPVCTCRDICELRELADSVFVHDDLKEYLVKIVQKTRGHGSIRMGVSPRGTLWLLKAAKAYAFINGREYVLPDDIKYLSEYVLSHRIIVYSGRSMEDKKKMIKEVVDSIEVPSEEWSRR
jgi:MoxR-like ATPase